MNKESESEVAQSCATLCNPVDCSLPGSSVHGIFQARVLVWVAISFSRESSWPRNWTWVSYIVGRRFTIWATQEVKSSWLWVGWLNPNCMLEQRTDYNLIYVPWGDLSLCNEMKKWWSEGDQKSTVWKEILAKLRVLEKPWIHNLAICLKIDMTRNTYHMKKMVRES